MEMADQLANSMEEQRNISNLLNKVAVWNENAIVLLEVSSILYFTVAEKKTIVHTRDHTYESGNSLKDFEQHLYVKGFFRSHKSFIVNMDYVEKIVPWFNSTYKLYLKGTSKQIPVSRKYTKALMELLNI